MNQNQILKLKHDELQSTKEQLKYDRPKATAVDQSLEAMRIGQQGVQMDAETHFSKAKTMFNEKMEKAEEDRDERYSLMKNLLPTSAQTGKMSHEEFELFMTLVSRTYQAQRDTVNSLR